MSAIFVRDQNDEGIELPVKELVSKSMLCMVFGLDEKEFLYIFNAAKEIESTMLSSSTTFTPLKPGKYIVKTGDEIDVVSEKGLKEMRKYVEKFKSASTVIVRDQPDDIVRKIMKKLDKRTLKRLAQTCNRMHSLLNRERFNFSIPITIVISLDHTDTQMIVLPNTATKFNKMKDIDEDHLRCLTPFRFKAIQLCVEEYDVKPEDIIQKCDVIIRNRIRTDNLVVQNVNLSVVAQLVASTDAKQLTFRRQIDQEFATFNTTEPFPNLDILTFNEIPIGRICAHTNPFSNFFSQKSKVIRFRVFYDNQERVNDLIEKYLDNIDRGSNKIFQIETERRIWDAVRDKLLRDRVWGIIEGGIQSSSVRRSFDTVCFQHNDQEFLFYTQTENWNQNFLPIFFGHRGQEFWDIVEQL